MRYLLFTLLLFCQTAYAQTQPSAQPSTPVAERLDSIPRIAEPVSLQAYEGREVTVVGRIVQVKYVPTAKNGPTFLDMHLAFPRTPFTLTVFERDRDSGKFPALKETYEGKVLEVTGVVSKFETTDKTGRKTVRFGITIKSVDQIKVVE